MATVDDLDRALQPDTDAQVLLAATGGHTPTLASLGRRRSYHRQPTNGDLTPECGNFTADATLVPRAFAEAQGYDACSHCFGGHDESR